MKRIVIFGNSGSGKSTLAKQLSEAQSLAHLDLDTIAWQPISVPTRKPLTESKQDIGAFIRTNKDWVIEGCYADLLEMVVPQSTEVIFLNLSVEACIHNAKNRPWEPHKYASKEAQDANLNMLLDWIAQYSAREDTFSLSAHKALFNRFKGHKTEYTSND